MGTTRAGSAVSMEAEQLKILIIFLSEYPPPQKYIYFSANRNEPTAE